MVTPVFKQCPECKNKAIGFFNWAKGMRWYKTKCDSCGRALKANGGTLTSVILMMTSAVIVGGWIGWSMAATKESPVVRSLIALGGIVVVGTVIWFTGGYVAADE